MKRSEMIEVIAIELEEFYGEPVEYARNSAKGLLERIEEVGMLPPLPKNTRSIETIYGESEAGREIVGKYLLDRNNGLDIHLWDSIREKRKVNPLKWEPEE